MAFSQKINRLIKSGVACALLYAALSASATPVPTGCEGATFTESRSVAALPNEVSIILGRDRVGPEGIADYGQAFNASDVVKTELPMRRLYLAALSDNCIFVAVERGGRGYSIELLAFEHNADGWRVGKRTTTLHTPRSMQELVNQIAK